MSETTGAPSYDPSAEVVDLCRDLIRIDTTNAGDSDGPGERKAAEHVAALLSDAGIEPEIYESEPGRASLLARWGGDEGEPLLVHGHLDVVPADAADWQVDPFSGEIQDGYVWGRGAVDMKDFDAVVLLATVADLAGTEATPENAEALIEEFGTAARMLSAVIRNTANPTGLEAGYKVNVVPGAAHAQLDGRFLPGYEDEFFGTLRDLLGEGVDIDFISHQGAVETPYEGDLVRHMEQALLAEDPDALVSPYLMPGGTDGKHWAKLGMDCYGFAPLRLPADLDFTALFHGVDERVPVDALEFGARVFDRFLDLV